jgi:uncharacterized protein
LAAILDIISLCDNSSELRFFAPWRIDPRPIQALLHGVYAFLGVADMWRALATDPETFPQAEARFARIRAQVASAADELATSALLTPAGERFVRGTRQQIDALQEIPVSPATALAAERDLARTRAGRNRERLP